MWIILLRVWAPASASSAITAVAELLVGFWKLSLLLKFSFKLVITRLHALGYSGHRLWLSPTIHFQPILDYCKTDFCEIWHHASLGELGNSPNRDFWYIPPKKIWRPFEFCICIMANGTKNFLAISLLYSFLAITFRGVRQYVLEEIFFFFVSGKFFNSIFSHLVIFTPL